MKSLPCALKCAAALLSLAACGGPEGDQLRVVTSYQASSCESKPPQDTTALAALNAFRTEISLNFARHKKSLFVVNRERTLQASVLRQYEGPFYYYLHPRAVEPREAERGVEFAAMAYLHADRVRTRDNQGEWSKWQRIRTRNFTADTPTVDGLRRWICLVGSEIAWAEVLYAKGEWEIKPHAITVYEEPYEFKRLKPLPTAGQLAGTEAIQPLDLPTPTEVPPTLAPIPRF